MTGLVGRKLLHRPTSRADRRYITLTLTSAGAMLLASVRASVQENLAQTLAALTAPERALVIEALQLLRKTFTPSISSDEIKDSDETKDNLHE